MRIHQIDHSTHHLAKIIIHYPNNIIHNHKNQHLHYLTHILHQFDLNLIDYIKNYMYHLLFDNSIHLVH